MLVIRHRRAAMQNEDRIAIFEGMFEEGNGHNGDLLSSTAIFIRCCRCSCTLLRWSKRLCAEGPMLCVRRRSAALLPHRLDFSSFTLDRPSRLEALRQRNGYAVAVVKAKV